MESIMRCASRRHVAAEVLSQVADSYLNMQFSSYSDCSQATACGYIYRLMFRSFFVPLLLLGPSLFGQAQSAPPAKNAPGPALVSRGAETSKPDLKQEAFVIEE